MRQPLRVERYGAFAPSAETTPHGLVPPRSVIGAARELQAASAATDAKVGIIAGYLDRFGEGEATCVVQVIEEALGHPPHHSGKPPRHQANRARASR